MIYQYPQPWLQTFWQQTMVPPAQGSTRSALSPAMPAGWKKKPGQSPQMNPMMSGDAGGLRDVVYDPVAMAKKGMGPQINPVRPGMMPTTKPGQGVQIDPVRPTMTPPPAANAFAHPSAVFGGMPARKWRSY